ncbi:hypothetical protein BP5796_02114 [Coleophoma crateriformis]|uniref:Zn(2)-C6 fungal-type domain-containing protein n=1 Tax=Coleophoma crateriformis TaxID=565419 RepID=A0A3D8SXF7_9HELO|nr:hypothetical protein BP5796_02114 [Coleophoma crateriformis]
MVGLSGRSKGCRTCRRRKIKCDERQPLCARCERGGWTCYGFDREVSFVSENLRAKRRSQKQAAIRAKNCESECETTQLSTPQSGFSIPQGSDEEGNCMISVQSSASISGLVVWQPQVMVMPADCTVQLFPELSLSAFKNDIRISFTLAKLFSGDRDVVEWLSLGYNSGDDYINCGALKALSSAFYGRMNHDIQSENEARTHYVGVLKRLSRAIGNNESMSLDVLVSSMTLSCYEMIASSSFGPSLLHAGGVGRLIEVRGPKRHRGRFELSILESMRVSIILKGMFDRKRVFLERQEWKTIPWTFHAVQNPMTKMVQDIMCDMPGLLEDFDNVFAPEISPKEHKMRLGQLKTNLEHHLCLLFDWRAAWESEYPNSCYERSPQVTDGPFSTVLYFYDFEVCNGLMLYHSLVLLITEIGIALVGADFNHARFAQGTNFVCTNPLLQPPGVSLYDGAIEVCRSVDYHISPPHESAGAYCVVFPLKKAHDELPPGSLEHKWVEDLMHVIARQSGFMSLQSVL